jgi:hypothetical protein
VRIAGVTLVVIAAVISCGDLSVLALPAPNRQQLGANQPFSLAMFLSVIVAATV